MRSADFYRAARAALDPLVKPLGFRRRGRFYYRIVNDVIQQFCLLWVGFNFTVRFAVTSVYRDSAELVEGDEIDRLISGKGQWLGMWMEEKEPGVLVYKGPCSHPPHIDLDQCGQICAGAVRDCLLPFFEEAADSESALRLLWERGMAFPPADWPEGVDTFADVGFLLGMGEWERAGKALKAFLSWPHGDQGYWNTLWKLYDALEQLDVPAVLAYMEEREAAAYAELNWKGK